jgi:hypothetical protein
MIMAKAKITKKGNVQVTMSQLQYQAISDILMHVRLGDSSNKQSAISKFAIDLEGFDNEHGFTGPYYTADNVTITHENKNGIEKTITDFTIEITDTD